MFVRAFTRIVGVALLVVGGSASAERFFDDGTPGVVGHAVDREWDVEALYRSVDDGDRLLAGVGGISMESPYVGSCISFVGEEGPETLCEAAQPFYFLFKRGRTTLARGVADLISFLPDPENPCSGEDGAPDTATCMNEIASPECVAEGELCAILGEVVEFCAHAGVGGGVEFLRRPLNGVTIQPGDTLSIYVRNLDDSGNVVRGSSKIFQSSFTDDHPVEPIANGIEICDLANPFHLAAAVPVPEVEEEEAEAELVGGL